MPTRLFCCVLSVAVWIGHGAVPRVEGQTSAPPRVKGKTAAKSGDVRNTTVEVLLLTQDGGSLQAQQWRAALEPLEISISIRRGMEGEKLETTEKMTGTFRKVTAVGKLDRSGKITFADRTFEPGDRVKIKQWIVDLQTFGAQGSPQGKPLWGLTEAQFNAFYHGLTEVVNEELLDEELESALRSLPLPAEYPLRWSPAAEKRISRETETLRVKQPVTGFSLATTLAVILNDHGLGFRPQRTPAGSLEILIDAPNDLADVWPVGWPLKLPRQKAAPQLFQLQQVFFDDLPLGDVLATASQAADVPVLYDSAELERLGGDWKTKKVSCLPRQATWNTVMKDVLNKAKLTFELYQDEGGRPFLYVTSIKSKRALPK